MGLKQYVKGFIYEGGYILDLVIIREYDDIIKSVLVINQFIFDYVVVFCFLNFLKLLVVVKEINYRQLKVIDLDVLCVDFRDLDLCIMEFIDVDEMVNCYNFIFQVIFDKYVFLKIKIVVNRK